MVQSSCDYRIQESVLAIFVIFKLFQKQKKLRLKLEHSCQTLVNYILRIEIFQTAGLLRLIMSYMKVIN